MEGGQMQGGWTVERRDNEFMIFAPLEEAPHEAPSLPQLKTPRQRVIATISGSDAETEQMALVMAAAPELLAAMDPVGLESVAAAIEGEHAALAAMLMGMAKRQRAAVLKATG